MKKPVRIKIVDPSDNIVYLFHDKSGSWRCVSASGTPLGFEYAGVKPNDYTEFMFALEDTGGSETLIRDVLNRYLPQSYKYTFI